MCHMAWSKSLLTYGNSRWSFERAYPSNLDDPSTLGYLSSKPQRIQWPMVILDNVSNILFWNQVLVEICATENMDLLEINDGQMEIPKPMQEVSQLSPQACLNRLYYLGLALKRICEGSSSGHRSPTQVRYVTCQIIPHFFHVISPSKMHKWISKQIQSIQKLLTGYKGLSMRTSVIQPMSKKDQLVGQPAIWPPRIWQPFSVLLNDMIAPFHNEEASLTLQSYKLPCTNNRYDELYLIKQSHIGPYQHPIYSPTIVPPPSRTNMERTCLLWQFLT